MSTKSTGFGDVTYATRHQTASRLPMASAEPQSDRQISANLRPSPSTPRGNVCCRPRENFPPKHWNKPISCSAERLLLRVHSSSTEPNPTKDISKKSVHQVQYYSKYSSPKWPANPCVRDCTKTRSNPGRAGPTNASDQQAKTIFP